MIYRCCVDLDYILRQTPRNAATMLRDEKTGRRLRSEEVYALATVPKARGYDAMPTCDHHDERGHCLGHATETNGSAIPVSTESTRIAGRGTPLNGANEIETSGGTNAA